MEVSPRLAPYLQKHFGRAVSVNDFKALSANKTEAWQRLGGLLRDKFACELRGDKCKRGRVNDAQHCALRARSGNQPFLSCIRKDTPTTCRGHSVLEGYARLFFALSESLITVAEDPSAFDWAREPRQLRRTEQLALVQKYLAKQASLLQALLPETWVKEHPC